MSPLLRTLPALLLCSLLGCGPSEPDDCTRYGVTHAPPPANARHFTCSSTACGDGLNPPTSGDHCGDTARCRVHDAEQNRCVWLHNLEHGHVVFLYNCPEGCPETVATLESFRQEAKVGSNGVIRAIVAPDSRIPTRVAAVLWRRSWGGDEPDANAIRCMLQHQDAEAPEPELSCQP